MSDTRPTVYIETYGCQMNVSDSELMLGSLEAHGYRARESVGHTLWEMTRWLDEYVKNAGPR